MSHADTIRSTTERIKWAKDEIQCWAGSTQQEFCVGAEESAALYADLDAVLAVIDALVAENQRLRDEYRYWQQRAHAAERALDGTPSAAQTLEDTQPTGEKATSSGSQPS